MMKDVAKGMKSFKEGMADEEDDKRRRYDEQRRGEPPRLPRDQDPIDVTRRAAKIRCAAAAARRRPAKPRRAPCSALIPPNSLIVAVLALIFIGPKDLPKVMRTVGYWVGRMRGMARHFTSGIENDDARGRARGNGKEVARGE